MKQLFFIAAILFSQISMFSQEKMDTIYFKDGNKAAVKITNNYKDKIDCIYAGEDMNNVIEKSDLAKIVFKSGRIENISSASSITESTSSSTASTAITPQKNYKRYKKAEDLSDPEYLRMLEVENQDILGESAAERMLGVSAISLSCEITDKAKSIIGNVVDEKETFVETFAKEFNNSTQTTYKMTSESGEYTSATLHVVRIDANDGELYGYIDFFKANDTKPFLSLYVNGNGSNGMLSNALKESVQEAAGELAEYLSDAMKSKEIKKMIYGDRPEGEFLLKKVVLSKDAAETLKNDYDEATTIKMFSDAFNTASRIKKVKVKLLLEGNVPGIAILNIDKIDKNDGEVYGTLNFFTDKNATNSWPLEINGEASIINNASINQILEGKDKKSIGTKFLKAIRNGALTSVNRL